MHIIASFTLCGSVKAMVVASLKGLGVFCDRLATMVAATFEELSSVVPLGLPEYSNRLLLLFSLREATFTCSSFMA